MQSLHDFAMFFLEIDKHLDQFISSYGALTYLILFGIVFAETGLVVTPFLPGDSLLFAAGALAGLGKLNVWLVAGTFMAAAALGDTTNYWVGRTLGPRLMRSETSRFLNKKHLASAHAFFEKWGILALILARFLPIIRTFMPFTAGLGAMPYWRFLGFSAAGSVAWVGLFVFGGFWFGNLPRVKDNFGIVVLGIVAVSVLPAAIGAGRALLRARAAKRGPGAPS